MRALAVAMLLLMPLPVLAANADNPDRNVNKTNDKGGDTGNAKVEDLNRSQLDVNQKPPPPSPPPVK